MYNKYYTEIKYNITLLVVFKAIATRNTATLIYGTKIFRRRQVTLWLMN